MIDIADPRVFPERIDAAHSILVELAQASLAAPSRTRVEEIDRALVAALVERLRSRDGRQVSDLIAASPSAAVARHLWRRLIEAWREASRPGAEQSVAVTLFALPLVIIAAANAGDGADAVSAEIAGVLGETEKLAEVMRLGGALAGNQTFVLSNALASADTIDLPRLPDLLQWQSLGMPGSAVEHDVPPAPVATRAGQEGVHLRFVIGTALAVPGRDLLVDRDVARWGLSLAQELARQLAAPGLSVLALPGAPHTPLGALQHGRAAQREVGAQLFASNTLRRLRGAVGEPSAIVSAHRCPAAPGGGELRLSLSSPFDPRQAEGFRCPLFPTDQAADVAGLLVDLLRDCRVGDVRVLKGVHADRDPHTGLTLLFKPDAMPEGESVLIH
ncbi:MAG: hypothetical protein E6H74_01625 [Betaproteobacteria bacterium]|nr:MAG: hypothetical protein E6H74_01625 [Betaproteobacteria bacterium]